MSSAGEGWALLRNESPFWAMDVDSLDAAAVSLARGEPVASARPTPVPVSRGRTVLIPVVGPLVRNESVLTKVFGFSSYARIRTALVQAASDPSVDRIVLLVDSPGGAALGCEEAADAVANAARIKPVTAYVDGMSLSAAMWLSSQATQIVATKSALLGSVGVFSLHLDVSRALNQAGVKPTLVVADVSPRKTELSGLTPLSDDARKREQADIDYIADCFIGALMKGRKVPRSVVVERFGRGRSMFANEARAAGMIDEIGPIDVLLASPAERKASALAQHRRDADRLAILART